MLKQYTPKPFRFFQTIYPSVYTFPPQKQENDLIKRYLDQPENGKWVTLDYKDLKYSASEEIDFDWIELQMNYASSLSKRDILTASSYTFRGDRLINSYKRNQLNPEEFEENFYEIDDFSWDSNLFPFFPQFVDILNNDDIIIIDKGQYTYRNYRNMIELGRNVPIETWEKIFELFLKDFRKIIDNSPALIKEITTWRGMDMDFMYHYRNNNKTNFYENTQFLSTSFNFYVANSFISETTTYNKSGTELYCCFLNIKIPVGTHVLLLMPYSMYLHEYEVLLKDKHLFKIIKTTSPQENAVTHMEIIKEKPKGKKVEQIDFNPDIENYFKEAGFTLFGSTLNDLRYLESLKV